jgi:hypothetical protein
MYILSCCRDFINNKRLIVAKSGDLVKQQSRLCLFSGLYPAKESLILLVPVRERLLLRHMSSFSKLILF